MGRSVPPYFSTGRGDNSVENHASNFPDPRLSGLSAEVRKKVADCRHKLLHVNKGPCNGAGDAPKWGDIAPARPFGEALLSTETPSQRSLASIAALHLHAGLC
jgi:hypothetical protein